MAAGARCDGAADRAECRELRPVLSASGGPLLLRRLSSASDLRIRKYYEYIGRLYSAVDKKKIIFRILEFSSSMCTILTVVSMERFIDYDQVLVLLSVLHAFIKI